MSCIRCGGETYGSQKICSRCLMDWSVMRKAIWDYHDKIVGKISKENLKFRQEDTKGLEKIWRKDKDKFQEIISREGV